MLLLTFHWRKLFKISFLLLENRTPWGMQRTSGSGSRQWPSWESCTLIAASMESCQEFWSSFTTVAPHRSQQIINFSTKHKITSCWQHYEIRNWLKLTFSFNASDKRKNYPPDSGVYFILWHFKKILVWFIVKFLFSKWP